MKKYKIHESENLDDANCMYIIGKYISSGVKVRSKNWADIAGFIFSEFTRWRRSESSWQAFIDRNKQHTSKLLVDSVTEHYDKARRRTGGVHSGEIP